MKKFLIRWLQPEIEAEATRQAEHSLSELRGILQRRRAEAPKGSITEIVAWFIDRVEAEERLRDQYARWMWDLVRDLPKADREAWDARVRGVVPPPGR